MSAISSQAVLLVIDNIVQTPHLRARPELERLLNQVGPPLVNVPAAEPAD